MIFVLVILYASHMKVILIMIIWDFFHLKWEIIIKIIVVLLSLKLTIYNWFLFNKF